MKTEIYIDSLVSYAENIGEGRAACGDRCGQCQHYRIPGSISGYPAGTDDKAISELV